MTVEYSELSRYFEDDEPPRDLSLGELEALTNPEAPTADARLLVGVVCVADVAAERVRWMWPGRIPFGKLTVLDGDPSLGKSTLMVDIAARITTGSPMPGTEHRNPRASVLLLSAEDGIGDTIRPRAESAGADLERLHVLESVRSIDEDGRAFDRPPSIPRDIGAIGELVAEQDIALIVVDVLNAYLSGQVDSYRDQDVRGALMPLAKMAERLGIAVVVLRHLSKTGGTKAIYRGGGSIGIIGAARAAMLVGIDPSDEARRILAVTKSNLAAMPTALAYRLVPDDEHGCARVQWEGTTAHRAEDLLGDPGANEPTARDEAAEWLRDLLADGPMPSTAVKTEAAGAGYSWATVRRAKDSLGIKPRKLGRPGEPGYWTWALPAEGAHDSPEDAEDAQSQDVSIFEHLRDDGEHLP